MITVDLLMSTKPCERWPRERVEALLARPEIDHSSWVRFAESCLAADAVPLADLRLTAYRAATPAQRLIGVRRSTRVRVELQMVRWPRVSDEVAAVRADLLRWATGEDVDLEDVLRRSGAADDVAAARAYAATDADADADDADAAYAVRADAAYAATAYAAAGAAGRAAAYGAAYAAEARAGLLFICGVLDGEVQP